MSELRHEIQRGEILRYLKNSFPRPAPPRMLRYHLRDVRYPCSEETLEFHLKYLAGKRFVELDEREVDIGIVKILEATITPAGIDELDRRRKDDPGFK